MRSCRYNLAIQSRDDWPGRRWPGSNRAAMPGKYLVGSEGCALDVVDANPDGLTFEEVAPLINRTSSRAAQIADRALAKLATVEPFVGLGLRTKGHT